MIFQFWITSWAVWESMWFSEQQKQLENYALETHVWLDLSMGVVKPHLPPSFNQLICSVRWLHVGVGLRWRQGSPTCSHGFFFSQFTSLHLLSIFCLVWQQALQSFWFSFRNSNWSYSTWLVEPHVHICVSVCHLWIHFPLASFLVFVITCRCFDIHDLHLFHCNLYEGHGYS